jgi:precorrin-6Y C5,15-methyltransferase (decarboxylating)
VPGLAVIVGEAPDALVRLDAPDAVFIGGGLSAPGIGERCWVALRPGGRLVANAVTAEGEAALLALKDATGGAMIRISVARTAAIGTLTGWRPLQTVTQLAATKPSGRDG